MQILTILKLNTLKDKVQQENYIILRLITYRVIRDEKKL